MAALLAAALASPAVAAEEIRYAGETEDGRAVKLVANQHGAIQRGAITVETTCTDGFDPFRARVEFRSPLDRTGPRGFKDQGGFLEEDDRYSGRYKYKVKADAGERARAGRRDQPRDRLPPRRRGVHDLLRRKIVFSAKRKTED